jgi:hypothetical protein
MSFESHPVNCLYSVSGQYGHAQRILYYVLLLVGTFIAPWQEWLAAAALGVAMAYGGTAAIHAFIIVCARARGSFGTAESVSVSVEGFEYTVLVWPVVWDLDAGATYAVVGVGFLAVIPMLVWSDTLRRSEARPILHLWTALMTVGIICALISNQLVHSMWVKDIPQWIFCDSDAQNITQSMCQEISSADQAGTWNETIWSSLHTGVSLQPSTCVCPCLSTTYLLRDRDDIRISPAPDFGTDSYLDYTEGTRQYNPVIQILLLVLIPSTTIYNLIIFVADYKHKRYVTPTKDLWRRRIRFLRNTRRNTPRVLLRRVKHLALIYLSFYSVFLSPLCLALLLVWMEYNLWKEPQTETFKHVGQWASIVAVALVLIATFFGQYLARRTRARERKVEEARVAEEQEAEEQARREAEEARVAEEREAAEQAQREAEQACAAAEQARISAQRAVEEARATGQREADEEARVAAEQARISAERDIEEARAAGWRQAEVEARREAEEARDAAENQGWTLTNVARWVFGDHL